MKILYGVQGTGNGHIARARAMAVAFRQQNIDVDFLFSGREASKYFSMEEFGNYQVRNGLTFYSEQGQVKYGKTFIKNNIWRFLNEVKQIDLTPYDLVLNDFEPVTAWAAKGRAFLVSVSATKMPFAMMCLKRVEIGLSIL